MRGGQALMMTRVVSCVLVMGMLLSVPVTIDSADELEAGLMFLGAWLARRSSRGGEISAER